MAAITTGFARSGKTGFIEVRARYGDRPGAYLLDSAATWDVINLSQHPIEIGEELESHGVEIEGTYVEAKTMEAEEFRIGRLRHRPAQVLALNLPYQDSTGAPLHGLLGYPLLASCSLGIDWNQQVLTFGGRPPVDVIAEFPLVIEERLAYCTVEIAGEPLKLRLETAGTFGLLIEQPDFDTERYLPADETPEATGRPSARFTLPTLQCGKTLLRDLPVTFAPNANARCAGRLGLGLLSKYNCWIDYDRGMLLLSAR